jgi:hypothetical protein
MYLVLTFLKGIWLGIIIICGWWLMSLIVEGLTPKWIKQKREMKAKKEADEIRARAMEIQAKQDEEMRVRQAENEAAWEERMRTLKAEHEEEIRRALEAQTEQMRVWKAQIQAREAKKH